MWEWIVGSLALFNLIAFAAHGIDKWQAGRRGRRTPEKTLLLLALPLASPGAWLGMRAFHHKVSKSSFRWKMAGVTAVNVLTAAALIYAAGRNGWF